MGLKLFSNPFLLNSFRNGARSQLKTFLELENGIPSADTFERIFARLNPSELQKCFIGWMEAVHKTTDGELINSPYADRKSKDLS